MEGEGRASSTRPVAGSADGFVGAHLSRSREALRAVLAALPDALAILDPSGALLESNDALQRMTGFSRRELWGCRPPHPFWPPESAEAMSQALQRALAGAPGEHEVVLARSDGGRFPALVHTSLVRDPEGRAVQILLSIQETTARKALEQALRRSEAQWRSIAEGPFDYVSVVDRDLHILYANPLVSPESRDRLVGRSTLMDVLEPAYREAARAALGRVFTEGVPAQYHAYVSSQGRWYLNMAGPIVDGGVVVAASILSRDVTEVRRTEENVRINEHRLRLALAAGSLESVDWDEESGTLTLSPGFAVGLGLPASPTDLPSFLARVHPDDLPGLQASMDRLCGTESALEAELRFANGAGGWAWLQLRGRRFDLGLGRVRFCGVLSDVTALKEENERQRRLAERVRLAETMDAMGVVATTVAHEFRGMITPILCNAELLLQELPATSAFREMANDILVSAAEAGRLVEQILDYTRSSKSDDPRPTLVAPVVEEALRLLQASKPANVEVVHRPRGKPPPVLLRAGDLRGVVTNLVQNAWQALPESGGRIVVEVSRVRIDAAMHARLGLSPGPAVRLSVSDKGRGMSAEVQAHMFDPFFTTRGATDGTGIGLAVVKAFVIGVGGAIAVESAPGRGTRVDVYMPAMGHAGVKPAR